MARVPVTPFESPRRRRPDTKPEIKPEGRFVPPNRIRTATDRTPRSVTRIRPDDKEQILPEMPYIPPA